MDIRALGISVEEARVRCIRKQLIYSNLSLFD